MIRVSLFLLATLLGGAGCASRESIPKVQILPNDSTLQIEKSYEHGPKGFFADEPLYFPPSTTLALNRLYSEPTGFIKVLDVEKPSKYKNVPKDAWKKLLDPNTPLSEVHEKLEANLSEIPWKNASRCFHAKLQRHTFPWGSAILFLTSYVQGAYGGPVNNEILVLIVQGLTNDGKYAVSAQLEIQNAGLPSNFREKQTAKKAFFRLDEEYDQAEKWLDRQPESSFHPTIESYLSLLDALRIDPK